jgi:acetylglutamate kinase
MEIGTEQLITTSLVVRLRVASPGLVIKVGGNELDDPVFVEGFVAAVAGLRDQGVVIVHGGGKGIGHLQRRLGLKPRFIEGLRVTDAPSLEVAQMVLSGQVNKRLVARLVSAGVLAVGLSGVEDGQTYNVNADHAALAVAQAINVASAIFLTNVPGVLREGQVISHIGVSQAEALIAEGSIAGGMIPKVRSALEAVAAGVGQAVITDLNGRTS